MFGKTTVLLLTGGILACSATRAAAEAPTVAPPAAPQELLDRAFKHLDANGDGQIDRTEFQQRMPQIAGRIRQSAGQPPRMPGRGPHDFSSRRPGSPTGRPWHRLRAGNPPSPLWQDAALGIAIMRPLEQIIDVKVQQAVRRALAGLGQALPQRPSATGSDVRPFLRGPDAQPGSPRRPSRPAEAPRSSSPRFSPDRGESAPSSPASQGPPPHPRAGAAGKALVNALDANGDGKIDPQEIARAAESLKKLDRNRDGVLDERDLREGPPLRQHAAQPPKASAHQPGRRDRIGREAPDRGKPRAPEAGVAPARTP
ncbi:MAG: EF-hand domain-containing protein [Phycisphaerae bacterium]|nr:EF-hand domain-containing protein [Phycisphaerae bacterium]